MPGLYRQSRSVWITSDGLAHEERSAAQLHERQLVVRQALAQHTHRDGTIRIDDAVVAILACPRILVSYPIGASK